MRRLDTRHPLAGTALMRVRGRQGEEGEALAREPLGLPWRWVLLAVVLAGVASLAASQWHHQPALRAAWDQRLHALAERAASLRDQFSQQRCAAQL